MIFTGSLPLFKGTTPILPSVRTTLTATNKESQTVPHHPRTKKLKSGPSQLPIAVMLLTFFTMVATLTQAQTDSSECVVMLPEELQEDTFFLQQFPDGQFRATYDESISFRLPLNTSQVIYLDSTIPSGIGINSLSIESISNLPPGLTWLPSQDNYDLPDDRDGCVRISGTPLQHGLFQVSVTVKAQVSIISQNATFTRNLFIAPPSSENVAFSMVNNIACGETTVSFDNKIHSGGRQGISYSWDFGNGLNSTAENPLDMEYSEPGVYPVEYQAVIDTVGFILTSVEVVDSDCDDFLGRPDFYIQIYSPEDVLIFRNNSIDDTDPPVLYSLNVRLLQGNYRLEVYDADGGLNGDDDLCGTINFNQQSGTAELQDGSLKVKLEIFHPVDTIRTVDSVIVFENPDPPLISIVSEQGLDFCEGDSITLASTYISSNQWFKNDIPMSGAVDSILTVKEAGSYYVSYTSPDGCVVYSEPIDIQPVALPEPPVLFNDNNLLSVFNPAVLPEDFSLSWYQEGNLLDLSYFALCIEETGLYRLEVLDNMTGCSNYFESVYVYNPEGNCITDTEEEELISDLKIYPNPTFGLFNIELSLPNQLDQAQISVVDLLGRRIDQQNLSQISGFHKMTVDLSPVPDGIYLVIFESESEIRSWKVVKRN